MISTGADRFSLFCFDYKAYLRIVYGTSLFENHHLFIAKAGISMVLLNRLRSITEDKDALDTHLWESRYGERQECTHDG